MDWQELIVTVPSKDVETASAVSTLISDGGLYIEDYSDMEQTLPTVGYYDYIDERLLAKDKSRADIHMYFHENVPLSEVISAVEERLARAGITCCVKDRRVREEDWANAWKKHFHPTRIGETLVVRPSWEEYAAQPKDRVLTLDPEMAFGTGDHETTRLMLEALELAVKPGDVMLDMGCGSGILSVAALLFGAKRCVAVDIDDNAVNIARKNARVNGFSGESFTVYEGNASADRKLEQALGGGYDVIAANIVSDVIIMQAPMYFEKLRGGGTLLTSGIIDTRAGEVEAAIASAGFAVQERKLLRGWVMLRAVKPE